MVVESHSIIVLRQEYTWLRLVKKIFEAWFTTLTCIDIVQQHFCIHHKHKCVLIRKSTN